MVRHAVVLAAVAAALPASAATRGQLAVNVDRLQVGQAVVAQVVVVGASAGRPPSLPAEPGLAVTFQGQSQRTTFRGTHAETIFAYQYAVTARQEGTWSLGPVAFTAADGTQVRTEAVEVTVLPRTARSPDEPEVTVEGGFDPTEAWEGQVVLYRYDARARGSVVDVRWGFPDFEGLRSPQQGTRGDEQYTIADPEGAITVSRGVLPLVATATGTREHPSAVAGIELRTGRPGVLGLLRTRTERRATEPSTLTVRPLPAAPEGFTGLVGEFVFETSLDKQRASVGQSVGWTLQVAGDGTLEGFSWTPPEPAGATVYAGDTERVARVEDGEYLAFAIAENVLVPTAPGTLQVPPLEMITFSPARGEYVTHRVEVPPLVVTGAADAMASVESFAGEPGEVVEGDGVDFRDIHRWGFASTPFLGPAVPVLAGLAALPGVAVFGALGVAAAMRLRRREGSAEEAPSASALLRALPESGPTRWSALDDALRVALADRVGVSVSALDREAALAGLDGGLAEDIRQVFGVLDRARFAGVAPASDPADAVCALVARLEAA